MTDPVPVIVLTPQQQASYKKDYETTQRNLEIQKRKLAELEENQKTLKYLNWVLIILFFLIGLFVLLYWLITTQSGGSEPSVCSNSNTNGVCSNGATVCARDTTGNYGCIRRCDLGYGFPCPAGTTCTTSDGKDVCLPFL